jgi:hypothetical protein
MRNFASTLRRTIGGQRRVLRARWHAIRPRRGRPHQLPAELVVSLTSFPARFPTLHLTIGCLLDQTVRPDRIVLWIANEDMGAVPKAVTNLERRGLEIRACDDLRSYKKLVPALESFPDAYIVTADDDLEFARDWLETLVDGVSAQERSIVCHRAHRSSWRADGRLADYLDWEFDVQDERRATLRWTSCRQREQEHSFRRTYCRTLRPTEACSAGSVPMAMTCGSGGAPDWRGRPFARSAASTPCSPGRGARNPLCGRSIEPEETTG